MACPHCGTMIHPDERHEMQQWGVWVPEGMHVNAKGQLAGKRPRTTFASYWLRGTAAAFVTWPKLVLTYLDAHDEHERTGSEESLKKFWNNDMGEPYVPKMTDSIRLPEAMKSRAEELPEQMVPEGVRFIVANVDVQKNAFVVQVHGIMPGRPHDVVVIDRFNITKSKRLDGDGDHELVKPNAYLDDWQLIKEQVMDKEYELADGTGRMMKVKFTTCDSGGSVGVTDRAYDFYRWLRERGENGRFILVKGDRNPSAPRTRISYPDSQKKDNKSAARGDIPLLMFNPNMLKDALNGRLDVIEPGRGMFHYPKWLPDFWYAEMCAEIRTDKGWENPQKLRNEAWDLSYYCLGVCISPKLLNVEMIDWENPPAWADVWDKNALVRSREDPTRFMAQPKTIDFGKFAEALA
jgi:phage terminase large subunit GpA-like protein